MLRYASRLTEMPGVVGDDAVAELKESGWSDSAIWEITALTAFFNFSGRMEAASGLPPDEIPDGAVFAEATASD
jgi:alkylhydroperoxidase family enzyme